MANTSKTSADFTPAQGGYTPVQPFRAWVQMTLPQVYDDALSYQELVYKLLWYINTLIENVETSEDNIAALKTAYSKLQAYVNSWFNEPETSWLPYVQDAINDWLDKHPEATTTVQDAALERKKLAKWFDKYGLSNVDADTANAIAKVVASYMEHNDTFSYNIHPDHPELNGGVATDYTSDFPDDVVVARQNIDCSSFAQLVVGGVPYDQSRYVEGNTYNHWNAYGYGFNFYDVKRPESTDDNCAAYRLTYQMAQFAYDRGYSVELGFTDPNFKSDIAEYKKPDYSNLQPGDLIFWGHDTDGSADDAVNVTFANKHIHHCDVVVSNVNGKLVIAGGGQVPIRCYVLPGGYKPNDRDDYIFVARFPLGSGKVKTNTFRCMAGNGLPTPFVADDTTCKYKIPAFTPVCMRARVFVKATSTDEATGKEVAGGAGENLIIRGIDRVHGYENGVITNTNTYKSVSQNMYTFTKGDEGKEIEVMVNGYIAVNSDISLGTLRAQVDGSKAFIREFTVSWPAAVPVDTDEIYLYGDSFDSNVKTGVTGRIIDHASTTGDTLANPYMSSGAYLTHTANGVMLHNRDYDMYFTYDLTRNVNKETGEVTYVRNAVLSKVVHNGNYEATGIYLETIHKDDCALEGTTGTGMFRDTSWSEFVTANNLDGYKRYMGYVKSDVLWLTVVLLNRADVENTTVRCKYDYSAGTWSIV